MRNITGADSAPRRLLRAINTPLALSLSKAPPPPPRIYVLVPLSGLSLLASAGGPA